MQVVEHNRATIVRNARNDFFKLKSEESAIDTKFNDVEFDFFSNAQHHFGALQHDHNIANSDSALHFKCIEIVRHFNETLFVSLECLHGLVGAIEKARDRHELMLLIAHVHRDDRHVFRDRNHRNSDGPSDSFGSAVAGARFGSGHVRLGHKVDVGPGNTAGVGSEHDGAVHLCQFRKALRAVGRIEKESARADVEHIGAVTNDDERAHARLQDAIEAFTQRRAGRDHSESMQHRGTSTPSHSTSLPVGCFRTPRSCCRRCPRQPPLQPKCQPEWPSCLREDREQGAALARA